MTDAPAAPVPDDKDWTWVLDRPCPDCGFVASDWDVPALAGLIRSTTPTWLTALQRDDVRARPEPATWSVLEYGAHVRDVHRTMRARLELTLTEETPTFANWDQDATALAERYDLQDPTQVAAELADAAEQAAALYDTVTADQRERRALRSNGSEFTVLTLTRYHLHDIVHHLHDIRA